MSKLKRYQNQVLPDEFNETTTEFHDSEEMLKRLKEAKEKKESVYAYCLSTHRDTGELELEFMYGSNVIGSVPLDEVTYKQNGDQVHIGRAIDTVGKIIGVKILDIDESDPDNIVVKCSRKDHVQEIADRYNKDIENNEFTEGMLVKGIVTGYDNNKVFVDIGGDVTAILGVADIARVYVKHPGTKYKTGDKVELAIKKLYANPTKISLSRAMMLPGWESIDKRFSVGKIVPGMIKNKIPTGVFIELNESFEGLAENLPEDKHYNFGDKVKVCILTIDKKREKIKLKVIENR